jgi:hypothetical protein
VKRSIVLFPLALIVPILFGCAPAVRVDHIQPVIPELQVRKKYPMKVALIVPPATQNMNTITISRSNCFGGVSDIAPVPFGNTFKETAVGTFSKMFNEVDVLQGFTAEKEYDLIIETTLSSLAFKNGCQADPGNYYQADGTVKLFDNDYREIWPGYRGSERETWQFWTDVPAGPVIGTVLSSLVHKYAQEMSVSSPFLQLVKDHNKPKDQLAAGSLTPHIPLAPAIKSDVDALPPVMVKQARNTYAIVIGIENYRQKLPQADFAVRDAQTVNDYLTKVLGYPEENVVTLLNDRAALGDMVKYFEKWLPNNVEPDSTVFVYYSGHGAPNPMTSDAYLVPYDGDPSFIDETGYSLKRMYAALGKLPAKEVIVALDSCFSGAGGRSVVAKGSRPLVMNLKSTVVLPKNMTVLSASSGNQTSSTYDEKGHGLFTYFMLKGIKNEEVVKQDGSLAISDLYGYIKPQVERIARKQYNNEQTPQLIGPRKN